MAARKISIRLPAALEALVSDRVGPGHTMSDLIREALEAYVGVRPTPRPTAPAQVPPCPALRAATGGDAVSDTLSDVLSDVSDRVAALASDMSDIQERLRHLEQQVEALVPRGTPRPTARPTQRPTQRPTPRPPRTDTGAASAAPPPDQRRPGRPPGVLRQHILDLLQAHPEGLSAEAIRVYVAAARPIGDTLQGMLKGGVIAGRGGRGNRRYVLTKSEHA